MGGISRALNPMKPKNHPVIATLCALSACLSLATAQGPTRHDTRSGVLEFEANGYPTDATVKRVSEEIDYQRAVQACIHFVPAVAIMQWRNAHFGPLGGKAGDLIIYRTTKQKMPIITANDTTTYVITANDTTTYFITFSELSDTGGLLMYEVPAGPTGGGINDLWQRTVTDTGMVGPDRGKGGKFLIVIEGAQRHPHDLRPRPLRPVPLGRALRLERQLRRQHRRVPRHERGLRQHPLAAHEPSAA